MQYKDYYKILGVKRDASAEEIKRAYRKLAHKYHPDISKETDAEARFKEINEAGEVLRDPEKRSAYDELGSGWRNGQEFRPPPGFEGGFTHGFQPGGTGSFSDFFESLFGREFRGGHFHQESHDQRFDTAGNDQTAKLIITLEDAFHGLSRTLQLDIPEPDHHGSVVNKRRRLKVKIPPGITEGQKIRLAGQGLPGMGRGQRGDLYLEIEFQPHPFYRVIGRDITLILPVTPWEAALGATVSVPTLAGAVNLKIPANSQGGKRMRLKGRGLPGSPAGDQYVELQIRIPENQTEEMHRLYEAMQRESSYNPREALGV